MVVLTVVVAVVNAKKKRNGDWRGAANPGCTTNGTKTGGVFSGPLIASTALSSLWAKTQHLNSKLIGKCRKTLYFGNGRNMLSISSSESSDKDLFRGVIAGGGGGGGGATLATQTFSAAVEVVQVVVLVNVEVNVEVPTVMTGLTINCRLIIGSTTSGIPWRNPTLGLRK